MKYLLSFLVLAIPFLSLSQSCCQPSSDAQFASLGNDPAFVQAHLEPRSIDFQGKGADFTFPVKGGADGKGYIIRTPKPSLNYLFVIHEWWGLNDHIKSMGEKFYNDLDNVNMICLDLYDGASATTRERAPELMQNADEVRVRAIIDGAIAYVGPNARVSTVGWCFGGGWSLQTTIQLGEQAAGCIMYYGMPEQDPKRIASIQADVLGIFASEDKWITPEIVSEFEQRMNEAEKRIDVVSYPADHAFANPSNPDYDKKSARDAYDLSLEFLNAHLVY